MRRDGDQGRAIQSQERDGIARQGAQHGGHESLRAILGRQRGGDVERDRKQIIQRGVRYLFRNHVVFSTLSGCCDRHNMWP
jgi:hypothetical protein